MALYLLFTASLITVCFGRSIHHITTKQMTAGLNLLQTPKFHEVGYCELKRAGLGL